MNVKYFSLAPGVGGNSRWKMLACAPVGSREPLKVFTEAVIPKGLVGSQNVVGETVSLGVTQACWGSPAVEEGLSVQNSPSSFRQEGTSHGRQTELCRGVTFGFLQRPN